MDRFQRCRMCKTMKKIHEFEEWNVPKCRACLDDKRALYKMAKGLTSKKISDGVKRANQVKEAKALVAKVKETPP